MHGGVLDRASADVAHATGVGPARSEHAGPTSPVWASIPRSIADVADTSCHGELGPRPITEDEPPRPSAWGCCLTPALDSLDGYVVAGLPSSRHAPGGSTAMADGKKRSPVSPNSIHSGFIPAQELMCNGIFLGLALFTPSWRTKDPVDRHLHCVWSRVVPRLRQAHCSRMPATAS